MVPGAFVHCSGKQLFDDHFFGHSGKFKTGVFKFQLQLQREIGTGGWEISNDRDSSGTFGNDQ